MSVKYIDLLGVWPEGEAPVRNPEEHVSNKRLYSTVEAAINNHLASRIEEASNPLTEAPAAAENVDSVSSWKSRIQNLFNHLKT